MPPPVRLSKFYFLSSRKQEKSSSAVTLALKEKNWVKYTYLKFFKKRILSKVCKSVLHLEELLLITVTGDVDKCALPPK